MSLGSTTSNGGKSWQITFLSLLPSEVPWLELDPTNLEGTDAVVEYLNDLNGTMARVAGLRTRFQINERRS